MKLFLDANVLIDFMSERLPHYLEAATIFTLAVEHTPDEVIEIIDK